MGCGQHGQWTDVAAAVVFCSILPLLSLYGVWSFLLTCRIAPVCLPPLPFPPVQVPGAEGVHPSAAGRACCGGRRQQQEEQRRQEGRHDHGGGADGRGRLPRIFRHQEGLLVNNGEGGSKKRISLKLTSRLRPAIKGASVERHVHVARLGWKHTNATTLTKTH